MFEWGRHLATRGEESIEALREPHLGTNNRLFAFFGDPGSASGEEMSEGYDQILDAAAALRAYGHRVEPDGATERWLIDGGLWLTDTELLALAVRLGLMEGPRRPQ